MDVSCLEAGFVADVTIPDGTRLAYGQAFTKTWRIRNTGTCAWPEDTVLLLADGDGLSDRASVQVGAVAPGDEADLSVSMVAPSEAGDWSEQWALHAYDSVVPGGRLSTSVYTGEPSAPILSGQVMWWTTPLPNVRVEFRDEPLSPVLAETATDENGRFVIENPPTGRVAVWAYAPGDEYMDYMQRHQISAGTERIAIYVTKPVLSGMAVSDASGTAAKFSWPSFPDATEYCVWLLNTNPPTPHCMATTSWSVERDLQVGEEYCWFVQAKADGIPIASYARNCFTKQ